MTKPPPVSYLALIFCLILTAMVGFVSCWAFHPRSRLARVAVLCGFTAFLLALLSTSFHRILVRQMNSETAVVIEVGSRVLGRTVPGNQEVILESDRKLVVGQELTILVEEDEGRKMGYAADDETPAYFRALLFALVSSALFTWGIFRLRQLGKDPALPPPEEHGTGVSRAE